MRIPLDDIKNAENHTLEIDFDEKIDNLDTDGNIKAVLNFKSFDVYISATGQIVANVKLQCDRCLNDFTKKFELNIDETYRLGTPDNGYNHEVELKEGDFVIDLNSESEIDVDDLIYQSLILNIPNPCVCDINCKGDAEMEKYMKKEASDPRLEVFKNINLNKD